MKKTLRYLVTLALALCMMQAFALADAPITVQLDGQNVTFTDAQPQIVNDRTFLPVRAVFEAMGATVDFNDGVVTAERGGRTVKMTIDSTEASVIENGKTTTLTMDVAPFIDAKLSRTYVPVRFAAQALGANVGWDGEARTVVIVDTGKQLSAALEGKSFTYLDKLSKYTAKYNEGLWTSEVAMKGSLDMDMSAMTGEQSAKSSIPMAVTAKGTTQDGAKMDMTEKLTVDITSLVKQSAGEAKTDEEKAMLAEYEKMAKALSESGIAVAMRGDLSTGKIYMNLDLSALGKELTETLGMDKDTWIVMDFNAMGIDFAELLAQSQKMDVRKVLESTLSTAQVNSADKSYAEFSAMLKAMAGKLSDEGFTKNGDVYTTTVEQTVEGMALKLALSLTMKNDAVAAYGVDMTLAGAVEGAGAMNVGVKMDVDEQDKVSGKMTMDLAGTITGSFDITGSYVKGGDAPQTQPPAGAKLVDLMEQMGSLPLLGK